MEEEIQKVLIYVVQNKKLLVFRQPEFPEAGIQVPAGTVQEGEDIEDAALRELEEETGKSSFTIFSYLGVVNDYMHPIKNELQTRHFFQIESRETLPERWTHEETHNDEKPAITFEFFWIPLDEAHSLAADQGVLMDEIQ